MTSSTVGVERPSSPKSVNEALGKERNETATNHEHMSSQKMINYFRSLAARSQVTQHKGDLLQSRPYKEVTAAIVIQTNFRSQAEFRSCLWRPVTVAVLPLRVIEQLQYL